ncbi:hypothetical protein NQZ79_g5554 [Umbelopsis isabellina]|nr:hypothetical protein NQZ79_g5554 [Umbelopsis isabellina]
MVKKDKVIHIRHQISGFRNFEENYTESRSHGKCASRKQDSNAGRVTTWRRIYFERSEIKYGVPQQCGELGKAQRQSMGFGVGDPHHRNRVFVIVKLLGLRIIKDGPNKAFLDFFPSFFLVIFSSTIFVVLVVVTHR